MIRLRDTKNLDQPARELCVAIGKAFAQALFVENTLLAKHIPSTFKAPILEKWHPFESTRVNLRLTKSKLLYIQFPGTQNPDSYFLAGAILADDHYADLSAPKVNTMLPLRHDTLDLLNTWIHTQTNPEKRPTPKALEAAFSAFLQPHIPNLVAPAYKPYKLPPSLYVPSTDIRQIAALDSLKLAPIHGKTIKRTGIRAKDERMFIEFEDGTRLILGVHPRRDASLVIPTGLPAPHVPVTQPYDPFAL
jgi:hypothetical protein